MKKLMIIITAICMACATQAATWSWKIMGTTYTPGSPTTTLASGTVYLFDAASISQAALLTAFLGGTSDISTKAVVGAPTVTITSGASSGVTADFTYGTATTTTFYGAIVSGNYIYIGTTKDVTGLSVGTAPISLPSMTTASQSTFDSTVQTYGNAGWYTGSAVPEPASIGLLMLGLCALGLKRKIA